MDESRSIAVVGAGIAGLTAAYRLTQAGHRVTVFERADYVGGRIKSMRKGDFLFDLGASVYPGSYMNSVDLITEVGLGDQLSLRAANAAFPRDGVLKTFDYDHPLRAIIKTDYLSTRSKLKALKLGLLLFRHRKALGYGDSSGVAAIDTETIASYCDRELDDELNEYVAGALVRGTWLTRTDEASLGLLLWTLQNITSPGIYGLAEGNNALPEELASRVNVKLNTSVGSVVVEHDQVRITHTDDTGDGTATFDGCIIATTADQALAMFPQMSGAQRALYESIEYTTLINVSLGLRRRPTVPAGYILVAPCESPTLLSIIADHNKAPGRAPDNKGLLTIAIDGRSEWGAEHWNASDEVFRAEALRLIKPYYGDLTHDVEETVVYRWPQVVPMCGLGHFKRVVAMERESDDSAPVQLAGDIDPISGVNSALVSGEKAASRMIERFRCSSTTYSIAHSTTPLTQGRA